MIRKTSIFILAALIGALWLAPAFSQEDIKQILNPAFETHKRPAVVFEHDAHNEMAGLEECLPCHHEDYEDGQFIEGDFLNCADCHYVEKEEGVTPLKLAYHRQCIDCHKERGAGPVSCGNCHVKE